jgi:hypothetical protein
MLGLDYKGDKSTVVYTEDYAVFIKDLVHFKPVNITSEQFDVQVWNIGYQGDTVLLRWWAIPAEDKGLQHGRPISRARVASISFDKERYNLEERAVVTVDDPKLSIVEDPSGHVKAVLSGEKELSDGVTLILTNTADEPNIYKKEIVISRGSVIVDGRQVNIPQLTQSKILYAGYRYQEDKKMAMTRANVNEPT